MSEMWAQHRSSADQLEALAIANIELLRRDLTQRAEVAEQALKKAKLERQQQDLLLLQQEEQLRKFQQQVVQQEEILHLRQLQLAVYKTAHTTSSQKHAKEIADAAAYQDAACKLAKAATDVMVSEHASTVSSLLTVAAHWRDLSKETFSKLVSTTPSSIYVSFIRGSPTAFSPRALKESLAAVLARAKTPEQARSELGVLAQQSIVKVPPHGTTGETQLETATGFLINETLRRFAPYTQE